MFGYLQAHIALWHTKMLSPSQVGVLYAPLKYQRAYLKAFKAVLRSDSRKIDSAGFYSDLLPELEIAFYHGARMYSFAI